MRKITSLLLLAVSLLIAGTSCKKFVPYGSFESMTVGAYVTLVKNGNLILDYANLNSTQADITVKQYGSDIKTIKVYASEGLTDLDKNNWKFVKEFEYNGGEQQLVVKATELAAGLGIQPQELKTGFQYTFYNELLLKDGRVFNPANTAAAFQGISNYNMAMTWSAVVVCPFSPMGGEFEVIQDDWFDWSAGDVVTVSDVAGNKLDLSAVWPNPAYGDVVQPLTISIDPATGAATIPAGIVFGNYGAYNAKTLSGSTGYAFACTGVITLRIHVDAGPYGDQGYLSLILKKL